MLWREWQSDLVSCSWLFAVCFVVLGRGRAILNPALYSTGDVLLLRGPPSVALRADTPPTLHLTQIV